jgi:hypothetical protein
VGSYESSLNGTLAHDHSTRRETNTDHQDDSKIVSRKCAAIANRRMNFFIIDLVVAAHHMEVGARQHGKDS